MADRTSKILPSCIPLPLKPEELDEIVTKAKDYALMKGICMRQKANFNPDSLHVSESAKIQGRVEFRPRKKVDNERITRNYSLLPYHGVTTLIKTSSSFCIFDDVSTVY